MGIKKTPFRGIKNAHVDVTDFGARGDGVTDDTSYISAALATGRDVFIPKGVYRVRGGKLYTRRGQKLYGAGIGATILKLVDNAGDDRKTILEMESYSTIIDLEIDGNYVNNSHDKELWDDHTDAPFCQGIYTSRYISNANVPLRAEGCYVDRVSVHDTIRTSFVLTGKGNKLGTVYARDAEVDHHLYFSGAEHCSVDTAYCSGACNSSSVAMSTPSTTSPPGSVATDITINNLYIKDIEASDFYNTKGLNPPNYIFFRAWTVNNDIFNASFNNVYIDDVLEPFSEKRLLVERNWVVNIGSLTIRTADVKGKRVLDVNNGKLSVNTCDIRLVGTGDNSEPTEVVRVVSDAPDVFKTGLTIDFLNLDLFENQATQCRIFVNNSSNLHVNALALRGQRGILHRMSATNGDVHTVVGVMRMSNDGGGNPYNDFAIVTATGDYRVNYTDMAKHVLKSASADPLLNHNNIVEFTRTEPGFTYGFQADINYREFLVVGDGFTTLQHTTRLKTIDKADMLTVAGRVYKFIWKDDISYQIG